MLYHPRILTLVVLSILSLGNAFAQAPPRDLNGHFYNGAIELFWSHPESDATPIYYSVYRSVNYSSTFSLIGMPHDTHFMDNAISSNNFYRYQLRAAYSET